MNNIDFDKIAAKMFALLCFSFQYVLPTICFYWYVAYDKILMDVPHPYWLWYGIAVSTVILKVRAFGLNTWYFEIVDQHDGPFLRACLALALLLGAAYGVYR